jgi:ribonuclease BN (tRNA processing enzyme)
MEITIVGGFGGVSPNRRCTSVLINNKLLIDAGAGACGLSDEQKKNLKAILISHTHLDHIRELPHLCRDLNFLKKDSIDVFCNKFTEESLREHVFNGVLYDNYIDGENAFIHFKSISQNESFQFDELTIIPIKVNHPCDAYGYVVKEKDNMVFFTIDTGPSRVIWEKLAEVPGELKAIFIDVSFPNSLQDIADVSGHHTPQTLLTEMRYMPESVQVFATHVKPFYLASVKQELENMSIKNLHVVDQDQLVLKF